MLARLAPLLLVGLFLGCSSSSAAPVAPAKACAPGAALACSGPGACTGSQACLADGSGYGACACGAAGTGGQGASSGAAGMATAGASGGGTAGASGGAGAPGGGQGGSSIAGQAGSAGEGGAGLAGSGASGAGAAGSGAGAAGGAGSGGASSAGAGGSGDSAGGAAGEAGASAASLAAIQATIMTQSCAISVGCHSMPKKGAPAGYQVFGATDGSFTSQDLFLELVGQPSNDDPSLQLVVPGHPEQSFLYAKVVAASQSGSFQGTACDPSPVAPATCGFEMPMVGAALSADQIAQIESWISQGALDN